MRVWQLTEAQNETEDIKQRSAKAAPAKINHSAFGNLLDIGSLHVATRDVDEEEDDEQDWDGEDRFVNFNFKVCAL